jgi:uncharacterized heparinase superfamily protein
MAGLSIVQRAKLLLLSGRRTLNIAAGRVRGHPWIRLEFFSRKTERLLTAPQDLRTADGTRASEIYAGRFAFAGKVVISDGRSPFELIPPSEEWAKTLLGFRWLRHLRAAESGITRANARALVDEWIAVQGGWHPVGWRPDILSRRIISWLSQSPLILHDADAAFHRRFLRNLLRQVRYLRHAVNITSDGVPRLQALIALTYSALCISGQSRHLRATTKRLASEIERQILPDGGHISRNPNALIELLLDFLPLRQSFAARNLASPPQLNNAIDRMMPMVRFFRLGDGEFANFNGMGPTQRDLISAILAHDDARGSPPANAPHSGYQRLEVGPAVLVMDTGVPPPFSVSREAHAGCLAFELSHGSQRIIVNCGLPRFNREPWRQVSRATAAHSTVVFNDTSSGRFLESGAFKQLIGAPILSGPTEVQVSREESENAVILRTRHNGYVKKFRLLHERVLKFALDGSRLDGEDGFLVHQAEALPDKIPDEFVVRFHLHPTVKASRLSDGYGATLELPNRETWTFMAYEDRVEIEESVYLVGPGGPRRTAQIAIYGRARKIPHIHWSIALASAAAPRAERAAQSAELPLST